METTLRQESRIFIQIGGALFGALIGILISGSIQNGAGFVFYNESEGWKISFWGNHHFLRIIASLIGTALGGLAAGCIAKVNGQIWGLVSALPTALFWIFVGGYGYAYMTNVVMTTWYWIIVVVLTVVSPVIGYHWGTIGEEIRRDNAETFDSRKYTILGVKWFNWIWLFFIIWWIGAFGTYSIYQGIWLIFGVKKSFLWKNIVGKIVGLLIYAGLYYLFKGAYNTLYLLSLGHREGLTKRQISTKILGWTLGIWLIVGLIQYLANVIMFKL